MNHKKELLRSLWVGTMVQHSETPAQEKKNLATTWFTVQGFGSTHRLPSCCFLWFLFLLESYKVIPRRNHYGAYG